MPITTSFDPTTSRVTHHCSGDVSNEEVEEALRDTFESPSFDPSMQILWDVREATVASLTYDQVQRVVDLSATYSDIRGKAKTAIVVSSDVDFSVGRIGEALTEN